MRRMIPCLSFLATLVAGDVSAQASQFGTRGLGHPGRWASARTLATGGALGVFDGWSSQNPAALSQLLTVTSVFTASSSWRDATNPGGTASLRDTRFPQILIGGPVARTPVSLSFSYSTYADRDFTLATAGVASPRGVPVAYTDTLSSRGGVNDLRLAGAWRISPRLSVGAGVHFLTGSNRLSTRRVFEDSSYIPAEQRAELAYQGFGLSGGFVVLPVSGLAVAGAIRNDGSLEIERDSTTVTGNVDLPLTLMGGVRFAARPGLELSAQVTSRSWSKADDGVRENGAIGARNTLELSAGAEIVTNSRRPGHRPIRLGVRHAKLPFLLAAADQPTEWGVSAGTGLRFRPSSESRDVGGLDLTLERIQRKQGSDYKESAWILSVGVTIFTGGTTP